MILDLVKFILIIWKKFHMRFWPIERFEYTNYWIDLVFMNESNGYIPENTISVHVVNIQSACQMFQEFWNIYEISFFCHSSDYKTRNVAVSCISVVSDIIDELAYQRYFVSIYFRFIIWRIISSLLYSKISLSTFDHLWYLTITSVTACSIKSQNFQSLELTESDKTNEITYFEIVTVIYPATCWSRLRLFFM